MSESGVIPESCVNRRRPRIRSSGRSDVDRCRGSDPRRPVSATNDPNDSSSTSLTLLQRIRSTGDKEAWDEFYRRYCRLIWWFARQAGLPAQDATDMVQEVMTEFVCTATSFEYDPGKGSFRGMLQTITRRRVIDRIRKRQASPADGQMFQQLEADGRWAKEWERQEVRVQLLRALDLVREEVEPVTYQAFQLYVLEGCAAKVVASFLGISEESVYAAKSRILKRLRDRLIPTSQDGAP